MRRILIITAIGFGLLAGAGIAGPASAQPTIEHTAYRTDDRPARITSIHDDNHWRHYTPPPRHWHRPEHAWHGRSDHDRYEGRYSSWR